MSEIKTEILLNAPIKAAWAQLTRFESYPQWNPFIIRIEGQKAVGQTLSVDILPPGGKKMTFTPILTQFSENKTFRWIGTLGPKWLFQGEHYFQLEEVDAKTTRLIHGEVFSGLLAPIFNLLMKKSTRAGFGLMNLKLSQILTNK